MTDRDPDPILVLFASTHGQTRRIADRVASTLREQGLEAQQQDLDKLSPDLSLLRFGGIVIGASVHGGHHQPSAEDFARRHHYALNSLPSAFFSVSLAAADDDDESRAAAREYLDDMLERTGWQPTLSQSFAGAILFSRYAVFERIVMRLIMRQKGHGEVKWDQEYTDWDAVDGFARDFAAAVAERAAPRHVEAGRP